MKEPIIDWNKNDDEPPAVKRDIPSWSKRYAVIFTIVSCALYAGLYFLVPGYRQVIEDQVQNPPIIISIAVNIYQPFLVVFIMISIALLILFYLKMKRRAGSYKPLLFLITMNSVFAAVLLGVTLVGIV